MYLRHGPSTQFQGTTRGLRPRAGAILSANDKAALADRYDRLVHNTQFVQLIARTFSALHLTARDEIADTLSSLVSSSLDCRVRLVLLVDEATGELDVAASEGFADTRALVSERGRALWAWFMTEKVAHMLGADQLRARWPDAPAALADGLVGAAIELRERPVGLLVVAQKRSSDPFHAEDLSFLDCATSIAAMAVGNAEAHAEQQAQRHLAELRAEQAAARTREKQAAVAELDDRLQIIEAQQQQITELSAPILQLRAEVLLLPLIGVLNSRRCDDLMSRLLAEISRRQVSFVILDVTGIDSIDTHAADHLVRVAQAARLLGTICILTGIRAAVAQTLVGLGANMSGIVTRATLGDGLDACDRSLRRR